MSTETNHIPKENSRDVTVSILKYGNLLCFFLLAASFLIRVLDPIVSENLTRGAIFVLLATPLLRLVYVGVSSMGAKQQRSRLMLSIILLLLLLVTALLGLKH